MTGSSHTFIKWPDSWVAWLFPPDSVRTGSGSVSIVDTCIPTTYHRHLHVNQLDWLLGDHLPTSHQSDVTVCVGYQAANRYDLKVHVKEKKRDGLINLFKTSLFFLPTCYGTHKIPLKTKMRRQMASPWQSFFDLEVGWESQIDKGVAQPTSHSLILKKCLSVPTERAAPTEYKTAGCISGMGEAGIHDLTPSHLFPSRLIRDIEMCVFTLHLGWGREAKLTQNKPEAIRNKAPTCKPCIQSFKPSSQPLSS